MLVKTKTITVCLLELGETLEDFVNDVVSRFVGCDSADRSESLM